MQQFTTEVHISQDTEIRSDSRQHLVFLMLSVPSWGSFPSDLSQFLSIAAIQRTQQWTTQFFIT